MKNNTLTRRALFTKFLKFNNKVNLNDPLFAKYSRKIYNGRKSSSKIFILKNNLDSFNKNPSELERVNPVLSGLAPYTGPWNESQAIHLLKRTGFGFKVPEVQTLVNLPVNDAINLVLNINPNAPQPPINNYNNQEPDENNIPYGANWTDDAFIGDQIGNDTNSNRLQSLKAWSVGLALNNSISIKEKMVHFWYHFIPIDFEFVNQSANQYVGTNSARICFKYLKMFRDNPTGNFKTLIRNMATQPAMMFYLNNQANSRTAPDENFAREIMELFTLGKDVANSYSQPDVIQAAKVLTGWRVQNLNTNSESTNFILNRHDTTSKQFSPFFNNVVIPSSGASEIDLFIDMIFSKTEIVSKYICRRLYRFFVYYDIDANIETNVITPLAAHFVANNWEMAPVIEKLFKSQHFFDMANKGVYIRSPFDLILGSARLFNINYNVSDPTNHEAQYEVWSLFNYFSSEIEQGIGNVPSVAGWQAFYQNPSFHEYWINSNSIQKRYGFMEYIFYGFDFTKNGLTTRIEVDVINFIQQFGNATCQDANLLVNKCITYLLPLDLSTNQKNVIKTQTLLSNQSSDYYWTDAWANYQSDPTNMDFKNVVISRLKSLLLTIVQYAEYQLM